ncbi:MAG: hypothetical protein MJZ53_03915 [Paludibacteraceae bacterium]|nr:hypothetical protein [Paludibacteraceae bacterium]
MKKLMYFAAALLVLAGCNKKDNALNDTPEGTPFKKGQQVTLTIGTSDNANQGAPRKVAGIDNTANDRIDFTWEVGDKILVKVGDQTAEFTLNSEPGLNEGEFVGTMPADGSTFDVQYPIYVPNITKQVYTTEKPIPADSMLFKATHCTLGNNAILHAQHAMVQFNLYGTDKTVGMIIFKNITVEPAVSDTLICTDGKTIDATSAEATPFYMIVPAGGYQFEVEIYDNATTPAKICSFATSAINTFTAGECLYMPAKEVVSNTHNGYVYVDLGLPSGLKWATMNVGATAPEDYGDYFGWGETAPHLDNDYSAGKYTYADNDNPATLPLDHDAANVNWGGSWRMPTRDEFNELANTENCDWSWQEDYNSAGVKGYLVTSKKSDNSIFLPAAGYYYDDFLSNLNSYGYYWSSSRNGSTSNTPGSFFFCSEYGYYPVNVTCYFGRSVRPVVD